MARVSRSRSESLRVATIPIDALNVAALLDFAEALVDEGVPGSTRVECRHSHETQRLIELSARVTKDLPVGGEASE